MAGKREESIAEMSAVQAWKALQHSAILVDVRSEAEWAFVGRPDLSGTPSAALFIEWQAYPSAAINRDFTAQLRAALAGRQPAAIFFLCRSGQRSAAAAAAAAADGIGQCINVSGGFEGRLDSALHRGQKEGWKAAGLPWKQT